MAPHSEQLSVVWAEKAPIALRFLSVTLHIKTVVKSTTSKDHQPGNSCREKALERKESYTR